MTAAKYEPYARQLGQDLARIDRRRRQQDAVIWLPRALLLAALVTLGVALLARWRPLLTQAELSVLALGALAVAASVAGVVLLVLRRSAYEQAGFADRQFQLQERTVTALEVVEGRIRTTPELAERQLRDATNTTAAVDPRRQMPLRPRQNELLALFAALLMLMAAIWLPNPQQALLLQSRAVEETIEAQRQELEQLTADIEGNESLTDAQREALQQPLEAAQQALAEPGLSQEEAVATVSEAESALRELSRQFEQQAIGDSSLSAAAEPLAGSQAGNDLAEALQQGNPAQAAAEARELAANLADIPADEREQLANALAEAAGSLAQDAPELAEQLDQAADALAADDTESAGEALEESAAALEERAASSAAAAEAETAANQLGAARREIAQAGSVAQETGTPAQGSSSVSDTPGSAGSAGQESTSGNATGTTGEGEAGNEAAGGSGPAAGRSENVFVPGAIDLSAIEGSEVELPVQCLGDPENCGPLEEQTPANEEEARRNGSTVPYEEVFGNYRDAAYQALETDYIPLGLRDVIRNYFSSLEPQP